MTAGRKMGWMGPLAAAVRSPEVSSGPPAAGSPAWNKELNRTHDMAGMRARAGRIVRAVEGRRRRIVAEQVLALHPLTVVDVGSEDGWIAEAFADHVADLLLVDVDPAVLARSVLAGRRGVRTLVGDAAEPGAWIPEAGLHRADVVLVCALLEHLPDPGAALRGLAPLLSPRGRFVVYVPADGPILLAKGVLSATGLGRLVRGLSLEPAPGHLHRFDRRRFAALLSRHGTVERVAFDPFVLGYLAAVAPRRAGS